VEEAGGDGPQQLRRTAGGGGHGGRGAGGGASYSLFFFLPPTRFDFLRVFGMVLLALLVFGLLFWALAIHSCRES
jgi:hypothetical protein